MRFYNGNGNRVDDNDQFVKLWKCRALPSAQHFAWQITTKDNLIGRGITLGNKMCVMCEIIEESVSHLFLSYSVASQIWNHKNNSIFIHCKIDAEEVFT